MNNSEESGALSAPCGTINVSDNRFCERRATLLSRNAESVYRKVFDEKGESLGDVGRILETSPNGQYVKLNQILGKGASKIVWKAFDLENGIEVAWNTFQTSNMDLKRYNYEVEILRRVKHPHIIELHHSWHTSSGELIFITELMTSGTLHDFAQRLDGPRHRVVRQWTRQILNGLLYLHSHRPPIVHRDIKCDNIFVNGSTGQVKIGDMGTAKMEFGKKYTVIGTPEFMAPEMYEEKGYDEKVDVYAFGMCLLELFTGECPYRECSNAAQIYKKVSQGIKPECLTKIKDEELLSLINWCLSPKENRCTIKEIYDHPFYASVPDVILLSIEEGRYVLILQVIFRGQDKISVKFEYDLVHDTPEDVVCEMVEEKVLHEKYKLIVEEEIKKILCDLYDSFPLVMEMTQRVRREDTRVSEMDVDTGCGGDANLMIDRIPDSPEKGSNMSWKRDICYKDELMQVRKEIVLANDRATKAETKAREMELAIQDMKVHSKDTSEQKRYAVSEADGRFPDSSTDKFIMIVAKLHNRGSLLGPSPVSCPWCFRGGKRGSLWRGVCVRTRMALGRAKVL